jgi:hypothetical protein
MHGKIFIFTQNTMHFLGYVEELGTGYWILDAGFNEPQETSN